MCVCVCGNHGVDSNGGCIGGVGSRDGECDDSVVVTGCANDRGVVTGGAGGECDGDGFEGVCGALGECRGKGFGGECGAIGECGGDRR